MSKSVKQLKAELKALKVQRNEAKDEKKFCADDKDSKSYADACVELKELNLQKAKLEAEIQHAIKSNAQAPSASEVVEKVKQILTPPTTPIAETEVPDDATQAFGGSESNADVANMEDFENPLHDDKVQSDAEDDADYISFNPVAPPSSDESEPEDLLHNKHGKHTKGKKAGKKSKKLKKAREPAELSETAKAVQDHRHERVGRALNAKKMVVSESEEDSDGDECGHISKDHVQCESRAWIQISGKTHLLKGEFEHYKGFRLSMDCRCENDKKLVKGERIGKYCATHQRQIDKGKWWLGNYNEDPIVTDPEELKKIKNFKSLRTDKNGDIPKCYWFTPPNGKGCATAFIGHYGLKNFCPELQKAPDGFDLETHQGRAYGKLAPHLPDCMVKTKKSE